MFARGDLGEVRRAVEAMEAAGLEAAEARHKLTRVQEAAKKVMTHFNTNMEFIGTTSAL